MDVLTDDHEREQVVRKWWTENWKSLAIGIVIAIAGLVGYRQYQSWDLGNAQQQAYELYQLQTALSLKQAQAKENAEKFIGEHEDIYGSLLALDLASVQSRDGDYEGALKNTDFAAAHGGDLVAPNALLAKARLLAEQKKIDEAINTVRSIKGNAYASEAAELEGDIYAASGDTDKAHDAYKKALELNISNKTPIDPVLQMKFDSVIKSGEVPAFKQAAAAMSASEPQI